jgi:SAM-dependent methyltransferase
MQPRETREKVLDHFEAAATVYSHRTGIVHAEADPIILEYIRRNRPGSVLEVGGGSGYLLDLIAREERGVRLVNCELAYRTYARQANPAVTLTGGDALRLPFAGGTFDYVVIKNVLHHLVGATRNESRRNAQVAADELRRVTRNGGTVFVVEQFHRHGWCAGLIFRFSLLFSRARIQLVPFGIRRNIIVSFLTPPQIRSLFGGPPAAEVLLERQISLTAPLPFRLMPFMSRFGRMLLVLAVRR